MVTRGPSIPTAGGDFPLYLPPLRGLTPEQAAPRAGTHGDKRGST
jgi:hypothetical protein